MTTATPIRPLKDIALEITSLWVKPHFAAAPYLDAMASLETLDDMYYHDSAREIVLRFLVNARTWKGDDARRIKAELNRMVDRQEENRRAKT